MVSMTNDTIDFLVQNQINFDIIISLSQNHLAHCEFATVPCPHCQQSVKKTALEEHTAAECRRRPMSCPDCVEIYVYEEKEVMLALDLGKIPLLFCLQTKLQTNLIMMCFFVAL